jgi:beta-hydroxylase
MASSESTRKKARRAAIHAAWQVVQAIERFIGKFSLIGDRTFFEPKQFDWVDELEANWEVIRAELDQILENREQLPNFQDISEDQEAITSDDQWKTYFLYGFGYKAEQNCARCPETTRLVEQVPGMKTAFFSILSPGKHIPDHRGPYKGVIRYHLGLKVPEPKEQCRIRVGDDVRHWEEGKSLIFDDTYRHEVWNDTDGERAILFMDVIRPMPFPLSVINEGIIRLIGLSPFVQDARKNQQQWAEKFEREAETAEVT